MWDYASTRTRETYSIFPGKSYKTIVHGYVFENRYIDAENTLPDDFVLTPTTDAFKIVQNRIKFVISLRLKY